ncbi:CDP-glycerol glycerophosphotransferase family protein [Bacteroides oleiciplenus]|uniref:CDP-glycerol:poly(Glycerophosphate) glycerophosphotransferase n=1 Tax=Bacteroides oleiciplenus YIT 12058 TaxID=742727 RepID=K9EUH6_9BACE|nr:CDP-glycerol glycerophosphotransferase family protein [Bacteroides oleiciplenus]EKU92820.1 hypothetical protein HMPREF9447_00477 [Bacteroides oleiciplenus YIT 12058]
MDLVSFVKNNKLIYRIYYHTFSFAINCLRRFVKTDDKLILFLSYGGRYFNDSPRCIYEAMLEDSRFKDYKLVWAFKQVEKHADVKNKVKIDTLDFYLTALKARCWVTNVMIERGLNFRGKNTYYLHTTHTTLPKASGIDDKKENSLVVPCAYKYDCSCAQSELEKKMQKSMFGLKDDQIIVSGYPKNDRLCTYDETRRDEIRGSLGITKDKIVILYAPTYRDKNFGAMKCPIDFSKWESMLGEKYVVLFRVHPVVSNATNIDSSTGFIYDVSNYLDNVDLMIASDILISDYSGIFFEYAVQDKPMFCFAYDYEEYVRNRSLYFDIRKEIPGGELDENTLLEYIKNYDKEDMITKINQFRQKYVTEYGHATEIVVNTIYDKIGKD